jgi:hypothetical protein
MSRHHVDRNVFQTKMAMLKQQFADRPFSKMFTLHCRDERERPAAGRRDDIQVSEAVHGHESYSVSRSVIARQE